MIITAERGRDRICTRCRGDVLVDGDGEARCWQCGREPGWERRPPPPRLDPLARGAPAPKPSAESARADFEYWADLLAAARLDLARPDVILPDPDGDTEETSEPSQTVEVKAATDPAAAAAVNPDEAELAAATLGPPEEPSGTPRQQDANRTVVPANSPFSWLAWQEAFRLDPDTSPAVTGKARTRRPGKLLQPRPQGQYEGPPGSSGATWQQGRLVLEWQ